LLGNNLLLLSQNLLLPSNKRFRLGHEELLLNRRRFLLGKNLLLFSQNLLLPSNRRLLLGREELLLNRKRFWFGNKGVLFMPQRIYRIKPSRFQRREIAEDHPYRCGKEKGDADNLNIWQEGDFQHTAESVG
jgi:hypothetical protein